MTHDTQRLTSGKGDLLARIRAVWQREQRLRFAEGALFFVRWAIPMFLVAVLIDWLFKAPAPVRTAMLVVVLGVPLRKAWRAGWRLLRPFDAKRTALQIEEQKGGMESLFVTAVQLRGARRPDGTSEALSELACRNAEDAAGSINAREAIPFQTLKRPAWIALGIAVALGLLSLPYGPLLLAGMGRLFTPWRAVLYPTQTQLELTSGDIVVQEGNPVHIAARISGVVPRTARLALRTGEERPHIRKLDIAGGACEYRIETAFRSFHYHLRAGDARSDWHRVHVVASPRIAHADVRLAYPAYTDKPTETVEALTLTVPETTRIRWTLSLESAVRKATLDIPGQDPVPLTISPDGRTVTFERVATESRAYAFTWVEREHGFSFKSPSHYLQVAPDHPPSVELTSPKRDVYALLGRKLNLAFRGRDDYGIGESVVTYRVDKTEEKRVAFTPANPIDGTEQVIAWDYRSALTNLAVGQSITFAVELADRCPPPGGPHRVRSEARRIQFMSREDYLAQVEKQKNRLLSRLRTIYREERSVHEEILRLDPADPIFWQTCRLEAVRQDLMRERVKEMAAEMLDLTDDLAANSITNQTMTAALDQLRTDLLGIADEHVARAATALRQPVSQQDTSGSDKAHAAHAVNTAARELGLLVLQLGYEDAADVMARELYATAQAQASLRLRTIMKSDNATELADEQKGEGTWLTRLFAASPRERESTPKDALIAFTLTRLVKQMVNGGIDQRLHDAADLIVKDKSTDAARLQSDVIAALARAAFRLRVGAEREALKHAIEQFRSQAVSQATLRKELATLDETTFKKRRMELRDTQTGLQRRLQLLLMPEIPAPRLRLFDEAPPAPPPAIDLLAAADSAMKRAADALAGGDRKAADKALADADTIFGQLADIASERVAVMTQPVRVDRLILAIGSTDKRLEQYGERQLSLLENTEDAAADGTKSNYLVDQQEGIAKALDELRRDLVAEFQASPRPTEHSQALPARVEDAVHAMRRAVPLLKSNKPDDSIPHEKAALAIIKDARALNTEHGTNLNTYADSLWIDSVAVAPIPYVKEIEEEQRDMLETTRKTKPEDLPRFAFAQTNLICAGNAILAALDRIAHLVEPGTVMQFAKSSMDSATVALRDKDVDKALDAQNHIVETLGKLRNALDNVSLQYEYVRQITEALHETIPEGTLIREEQRRLREKTTPKADAADLAKEQAALVARAKDYAGLIEKITGLKPVDAVQRHMAEAEKALKGKDPSAAVDAMAQAEGALTKSSESLLTLMKYLPGVLAPPAQPEPQEITLLKKVLAMAGNQKAMYHTSCAAAPADLPDCEPKLRTFESACTSFIEQSKGHRLPPPPPVNTPGRAPAAVAPSTSQPLADFHVDLVAAKQHLATAAASARARNRAETVSSQLRAVECFRRWVVNYTVTFYRPPPENVGQDFVFTKNPILEERAFRVFTQGVVTGKRPPDGKSDWEVLGKRDRAALNENFARELPLEYRAILKDYYERLAR